MCGPNIGTYHCLKLIDLNLILSALLQNSYILNSKYILKVSQELTSISSLILAC